MVNKQIEKGKIVDNIVDSWDQQPGEPAKAFKLFLKYLALGRTRNYKKVADTSEVSYGTVMRYANQYMWIVRADDHDLAEDHEFTIKLDEEILKSRIRQQRIAKSMSKLAEKGLLMLSENIEDLSAGDCARLLDVAAKVENLALGKSTEISEAKIESEVKVQIEEIDPKIAAEIGKMMAIQKSEETEINV